MESPGYGRHRREPADYQPCQRKRSRDRQGVSKDDLAGALSRESERCGVRRNAEDIATTSKIDQLGKSWPERFEDLSRAGPALFSGMNDRGDCLKASSTVLTGAKDGLPTPNRAASELQNGIP
jgi:hypothetical protein